MLLGKLSPRASAIPAMEEIQFIFHVIYSTIVSPRLSPICSGYSCELVE